MRCSMAWVAVLMACSEAKPPQPVQLTSVHRDCQPPLTRTCSSLAVITPREPTGTADVLSPPLQLLEKQDGVYVFERPALLQRFEIEGLPPRLQATSNLLLDPPPNGTQILTDGADMFSANLVWSFGAGSNELQVWSPTGQLVSNTTLPVTANYGGPSLAVFDGLALLRLDTLTIVDTLGAVRETVPTPSFPPPILGAYGCGFFGNEIGERGTLMTIPLDGRPTLTQPAPGGVPHVWPYDPHGLLFVTSQYDGMDGGSPTCTALVDILFDDGRAAIHHELSTPCGYDYTVLTMPFGVILGADGLTLLDANGDLVGASLSTGAYTLIPIGNYVAAVDYAYSSATNTNVYSATIVGCGD